LQEPLNLSAINGISGQAVNFPAEYGIGFSQGRVVLESTNAPTSALRGYVARLTLLFVLLRAFPQLLTQ